MKILAIDDQQLVLLPLEKRLTELGYEVKTAMSAHSGNELYLSFKPDMVIVDINMDTVSGLEVVKFIRNDQKSSIPVMILSGNTNEDIITEGFELGVDDYMKKTGKFK